MIIKNIMEEEIRSWIDQAKKDFQAAKKNFDIKVYYVVAFLCQQAVEKGLKALYIKKFKELKKTHDLVALGNDVGLPKELIQYCKELSPAYIYTRYPDVIEFSNLDTVAKTFLVYTEEVLLWVEKKL